ncbi:MAG TPA: hypothetical protein VFK80_06160 [Limnochordia bacterium]|nr:hypothetical protein [Limnochordia bacterium]
MTGWIERWQAWLAGRGAGGGAGGGFGPGGRFTRGLVLLGVCGIALMFLGNWGAPTQTAAGPPPASPPQSVPVDRNQQYALALEHELEQMIDELQGVANAEVMVTLENGPEQVFAQQVETDNHTSKNGSGQVDTEERSTTRPVTVSHAGTEAPIVRYEKEPAIAGVLVVADGAADPSVKLAIAHAVATALHLPEYRVAVYERR